MNKNIILVGFMGAGKTAVSVALAKKMKREIVSTDDLIIKKEARAIADIFEDRGEAYFRKIEKNVVQESALLSNVIIDCGGGVVIDPENVAALKANGVIFYLKADPEVILARVKDNRERPLLNVPDPLGKINELLAKRESFYNQADIVIVTDALTVDAVCAKIMEKIGDDR